jgi:hypothetical protein
MLTDTAMFRNPKYQTPIERHQTIDHSFMVNVTKAVVSFIMKAASSG